MRQPSETKRASGKVDNRTSSLFFFLKKEGKTGRLKKTSKNREKSQLRFSEARQMGLQIWRPASHKGQGACLVTEASPPRGRERREGRREERKYHKQQPAPRSFLQKTASIFRPFPLYTNSRGSLFSFSPTVLVLLPPPSSRTLSIEYLRPQKGADFIFGKS